MAWIITSSKTLGYLRPYHTEYFLCDTLLFEHYVLLFYDICAMGGFELHTQIANWASKSQFTYEK